MLCPKDCRKGLSSSPGFPALGSDRSHRTGGQTCAPKALSDEAFGGIRQAISLDSSRFEHRLAPLIRSAAAPALAVVRLNRPFGSRPNKIGNNLKSRKLTLTGDRMKTTFKKFAAALGLVLMGTMLTAKANAECGYYPPRHKAAVVSPQSWNGAEFSSGSLLLVSEDSNNSIVGMWKVTLTAEGNTGPNAPPDGATLDSALVQWHSDGTEVMNSSRPPQDGNVCFGVWEKTGRSRYKLNHFGIGNDTANAPSGIGNPSGPTQIVEDVTVSRDGKHYAGTFALDVYDPSNMLVAHIVGVITATRITVHTSVSSIF